MEQEREQQQIQQESADIKDLMETLLAPKPLSSLRELDTLLEPLPGYVGPGAWLKLLK